MVRLRKYRMVEGIGSHWNKRWEIQEKYKYFENGEWVYSWHLVFWSSEKRDAKKCLRNIKRRKMKMKIKEYKLYKTAKKTAKENSLEYVDSFETGKRNILFDFSLLDNTDELTDDEKQYIRDHALRYVYASNCEQFYGKEFDDFTVCDGRALYYPHKVYDEHGCERRYVIMQLAKIIHTRGTRKSVYDDYETMEIKLDSGYTEPVSDYEI